METNQSLSVGSETTLAITLRQRRVLRLARRDQDENAGRYSHTILRFPLHQPATAIGSRSSGGGWHRLIILSLPIILVGSPGEEDDRRHHEDPARHGGPHGRLLLLLGEELGGRPAAVLALVLVVVQELEHIVHDRIDRTSVGGVEEAVQVALPRLGRIGPALILPIEDLREGHVVRPFRATGAAATVTIL
jgi:hypothetical protein